MTDTFTHLIDHIALFPVVVQFLLIAVATGFGEEVAALTVFALARHDSVSWWVAISGVFVGAWIGHFVLWFAGRSVGHRALNWPMFRKLEQSGRLATIRYHMAREGWIAVAVARFLPGVRVGVFVIAGILDMAALPFLATLTAVTAIWLVAALGLVQVVTEAIKGRPLALVVGILVAIPLIWGMRTLIRRRRPKRIRPAQKIIPE